MKLRTKTYQPIGMGFQIIVFSISCIALAILYYFSYATFHAHEYSSTLTQFPEATDQKNVIRGGLNLNRFSNFDVRSGKFTFAGGIWFDYDPQFVTLNQIEKFKILDGKIVKRAQPEINKVNGREVAQFDIEGTFDTALDYRMFPLDDHYIPLGIANDALPDTALLISQKDDFKISDQLDTPGWKTEDTLVDAGYRERSYGKEERQRTKEARIYYILKSKRTDPVLFVTTLFALLVIFLMSVLTFSTKELNGNLLAGSLVAIVSYRLVQEAYSPADASHFMLSDYLFIAGLLSIMLALFSSIAARQLKFTPLVQQCIIVFSYLFFILSSFLIVWFMG